MLTNPKPNNDLYIHTQSLMRTLCFMYIGIGDVSLSCMWNVKACC